MEADNIPVKITQEALDRIAALGLQNEFEQMLAHAKQTAPRLYRITIDVFHRVWPPDQSPVILGVLSLPPEPSGPPYKRETYAEQWAEWVMQNLPRVGLDIIMSFFYDSPPSKAA